MNKKDIKNPPKKYRPTPFWSWNEKLDTEETKRQIGEMDKAGMGGFFMHARGGLQTEYLGDEWFDNVKASITESEKRGMYPWAYDENGWPSGFGDGVVCDMGEEYQQKYLRIEEGEGDSPHTICNADGYHMYYDVNPFYVDTLDEKVIKEFINTVHEKYYKEVGDSIQGFFTDEPEAANTDIPWSLCLPQKYREEYGEDILPRLPQLFKPIGEYRDTRMKFWRLVTKLFSQSYMKQICDWCSQHNVKLTGHLSGEVNLRGQMPPNGACMPHYEYFHIPGMDWLGRNLGSPLIMHQLVSAAMQTGKKQILSETFGLCGHNVSFSELRRIYEWQMVRGVNLLCQHLQGYSLRGIRKRDYPPAMYYQQPWWDEYKLFNDSMSRIGMLIAEGKPECEVLVIHPQTSAWMCYDNGENEGLDKIQQGIDDVINTLEQKHIQFHLGDEILIERHGRDDGNKFIIGEMEYTTVILPPHIDFFENTKKVLDKFKENGGIITTADELCENNVIDNPNITYLKRVFDEFDMHYFVNSTSAFQTAKINANGVKLDIMTGEEQGFDENYTFTPYDSLVVLEYKDGTKIENINEDKENLCLDGEWEITGCSENALTLDYCDCYFDGELVEKNMPVTSIQELACKLKRKVNIRQVFKAEIEYIPEKIYLVCETPENFRFKINGNDIEFKDSGYFRDVSFRKTDISKHLKIGTNEIELICDFEQTEKVYEDVENAPRCQSIRNKLTYGMEIEAVYLVGDFSVKTDGEYTQLDKNAVRYLGGFVISKPNKIISLTNIEKQGFPFFCGNMTISKAIAVDDLNKKVTLEFKGINAVKVKVNGKPCETIIWNNSTVDLSKCLKKGENEIEMTLYNNLRNLLGPHHLEEGECLNVRPCSFFKGESLFVPSWMKPLEWNNDYCFVEMSIGGGKDNG